MPAAIALLLGNLLENGQIGSCSRSRGNDILSNALELGNGFFFRTSDLRISPRCWSSRLSMDKIQPIFDKNTCVSWEYDNNELAKAMLYTLNVIRDTSSIGSVHWLSPVTLRFIFSFWKHTCWNNRKHRDDSCFRAIPNLEEETFILWKWASYVLIVNATMLHMFAQIAKLQNTAPSALFLILDIIG